MRETERAKKQKAVILRFEW